MIESASLREALLFDLRGKLVRGELINMPDIYSLFDKLYAVGGIKKSSKSFAR